MKLGLVSLGCDKNTVDSERILAALAGHGAEATDDLGEADVIVVNTCGFIDAARQESIDTLLEMARHKTEGRCRAVVAVGCLVERYRAELEPAIPEVDVFIGLRDLGRLVPELRARGLLGDPISGHPGTRLPLGPGRHVRYLKVSEGCNHGCAFCAIPLWRGRHRSFEAEALVAEAQRLEAQGTVELNLVAQDLAHYGSDVRGDADLVSLLRRLLAETTIPWLRLLYIYSAGIREPLLELMAGAVRLLPYLDVPIQHASDSVLEWMRRPERRETLRRRIAAMRDAIPDLTLRTTVMVGFPGETEEDFRALLDFLEETRFDRLGAFAFSPQPGTPAAAMEGRFVAPEVAGDRLEELLEVQRAISAERLAREVGERRRAIVDSAALRGDGWPAGDDAPAAGDGARPAGDDAPAAGNGGPVRRRFTGRLASQADDVDGVTVLRSARPLVPGDLVEVRVTGAADYDLEAEVLAALRPSPARPAGRPTARRSARSLPVLGLEAAWGR